MIPVTRSPSTTGNAPILRSPSSRTASPTVASAAIVATSVPLSPRIIWTFICSLRPRQGVSLDSPTSQGQREGQMPRPDPIPSPRLSMLRRFRQSMKWMALFSMAVAATAVLLVARGDNGTHIHMLIATALGAGLSVLLAGALMSLVFLSSSSGHDDEASRFEEEQDN